MTGRRSANTCYVPSVMKKWRLSSRRFSFSCINNVLKTGYGIEEIDKAMAHGFNWAPPSFYFFLFGTKEIVLDLMRQYSIKIPNTLLDYEYKNKNYIKYYKYLIAK